MQDQSLVGKLQYNKTATFYRDTFVFFNSEDINYHWSHFARNIFSPSFIQVSATVYPISSPYATIYNSKKLTDLEINVDCSQSLILSSKSCTSILIFRK